MGGYTEKYEDCCIPECPLEKWVFCEITVMGESIRRAVAALSLDTVRKARYGGKTEHQNQQKNPWEHKQHPHVAVFYAISKTQHPFYSRKGECAKHSPFSMV